MDCSSKLFLPSIFFLVLTHFIPSVSSFDFCNNNNGNYTRGSTYSNNLGRLLPSLPTSVDSSGFYYTSFGQNQDTVDAFVMCRADVSLDRCKNCTEEAISDVRSSCPNQMQVVVWLEYCTLKYANYSLYGKLEMGNIYYISNSQNTSSPSQFNEVLTNLLGDLRIKASNGGDLTKVAVGNESGPDFQTIFAMLQCKPDLSSDDCNKCLVEAIRTINGNCDGKRGCRILIESCLLRYESYPFYNETRIQELSTPPAFSAPPNITAPPPQMISPPPRPPSSGNNNTRTVIIIVASIVALVALAIPGGIIFKKRRKTQRRRRRENIEIGSDGDEISTAESLQYDFGKIRSATNDFSHENKLGQGGFGAVYKGKLLNGQEIAVKRLSKNSGQGDQEFKNEVLLLARLQHRNLVRLLGFSLEGEEKLLVYEYVQNASLDHFLFDSEKRSQLDWDRRSKIIGGVARGLLYLHEDSRLRIIHRDLKASNVLLDGEMIPKIADFGMARLFVQEDETQAFTSRVVGTYGYMAPEYAMHGQFSLKSDVFSFGVLLLEIISGQKNNYFRHNDGGVQDLLSVSWKSWQEGTASEVIDPVLKSGSGSVREMLRCIHIGLLCVQENVADRPTMASVVLMLSSLSLTLAFPSEPAFFVRSNGTTDTHDARSESDERKLIINSSSSEKSVRSDKDHSKNEASISELYPR